MSEERYVGCMLGLALGDAMGAVYEGGAVGQFLWWVTGVGQGDLLRWSDDTQMAMGLAESLVDKRGVDADDLARRWAAAAEWKRGYGPGAWELLRQIREGADWRVANRAIFPDGSLGNGAAMRAAPLGLLYHRDLAELRRATELASSITHAHPLGIEGGVLIARATAMALDGPLELAGLHDFCTRQEFRDRLKLATASLALDDVRRRLGTGIRAHESAVTAVYVFTRFPSDFKAMMEFVIQLGGDTDTIGAMASGIFGARNDVGALPADLLARLEARDELERLGRELFRNRY